jgi:hypothetical protein
MKKALLLIQYAWLFLFVICAAPSQGLTLSMEEPQPNPKADNNPQTDEPFSLHPTPELINIPYVTEGGARQMLDVHLPAKCIQE